ncbi:MAG: hypothetical protein RL479_2008, partial [Verrucomicrobiota bacterium]
HAKADRYCSAHPAEMGPAALDHASAVLPGPTRNPAISALATPDAAPPVASARAVMTSPMLPSTPRTARWRHALRQTRLPADRRWRFATEIHRFLRYCEILQVPPSRAHARNYLATVPLAIARPEARLALRWFLQLARRPAPARPTPTEPWWEQARTHPATHGTWYAPGDDEPPDALPPVAVAAR